MAFGILLHLDLDGKFVTEVLNLIQIVNFFLLVMDFIVTDTLFFFGGRSSRS